MQKCRALAMGLAARAMLKVGKGKFDDAWQDLLACHRLGRHLSRGATLIEGLVGIAISQIATNATLAYIEHAGLSAKQVKDHLRDLQALPPFSPLADKIDLGERFMFLDSTQMIHRGGLTTLEALSGVAPPKNADVDAKREALASIDWEPALRNGNKWYDRMAAALRGKDRPTREKEFDKIETELKKLKMDAAGPENLAKLLLAKDKPKEAGKAVGDVLIGLLVPAIRKVQGAYDRIEQVQRNLQIAFALAAYKSDNGNYPKKLAALAPSIWRRSRTTFSPARH